eukprot:CAMPEP_0195147228 /NCGR_PEP_ID=MMETSP0448-20130528/173052_1 /TAXON_ID=66468 /ORGANISM="Heterocapsa triquestra, Strain CCMP 448" /LENGTH=59 /DNA_ID=CAMNT_0040185805 /DNA_START=1 /DNA_END=177 /DNA_ORIENTATION=+
MLGQGLRLLTCHAVQDELDVAGAGLFHADVPVAQGTSNYGDRCSIDRLPELGQLTAMVP